MSAARSLYAESLEIFVALRHVRGVADCLVGLAHIAARHADRSGAARAARLLGAAGALRVAAEARISEPNRLRFERIAGSVRTSLGEAAFEAARKEGIATSLQEMLPCALGLTGPQAVTPAPG